MEHEQQFLRSSRWKDAAARFQFAKFLPQSAILDITLGASNITDIFLTFLTDKKVPESRPSENESRVCAVLVAMPQEECVVPFQLCRQKPGVCQIF